MTFYFLFSIFTLILVLFFIGRHLVFIHLFLVIFIFVILWNQECLIGFDFVMLPFIGKLAKKSVEKLGQNGNKIIGTQLTSTNTNTITSSQPYASLGYGNFDPSADIVKSPMTDAGTKIQGDISGFHKNLVVTACDKPECKTTNCADVHKGMDNPCGETVQFHQGPLSQQIATGSTKIVHELGGTGTHTIPSNLKGVVVDSNKDTNGPHPKGQSIVVEKHTTTLSSKDVGSFKDSPKGTQFFQDNDRTTTVISNLPLDSILYK